MTTIDQRVVEMEFDNAKFEKNARQTINTLNELNDSLDLDSADAFDSLQKSAKSFSLANMANEVSGISSKFTALGIAGITAIQNITNRAVDAGIEITKAFTIDPISTGLQEYETQINAIQTILANTKSKGTTLDDVNEALDELNHYADLTIYNFTQMTDSIGKFTTAGVDLETSTAAIKGIANLAALQGATSAQASNVMYQLSQALSSGKVLLRDWMSVENSSMGGEQFKNAIMDTARVHGIAIDEMIASEGSFRDTLSNGWLTSEILLESLRKFTGDMTEEELAEIGYTEDQIAAIMEMGQTALDAATKVKTFTQLMDTLKEAAQSTWTQTWEYVLGDYEEAKAMFSDLSNVFSNLISAIGDARNSLLKGWKDLGGRTELIQTFINLFNALLAIITPIKQAFRDIFPTKTAEELYSITKAIQEFTKQLQVSDGTAMKIRYAFEGLFSVFKLIGTVVKAVLSPAVKLLSSIFGGASGSVLDFLAVAGQIVSYLVDVVIQSGVIDKAVSKVIDTVKNLISFIQLFITSILQTEGAQKIIAAFITTVVNLGTIVYKIISKVSGVFSEFAKNLASNEYENPLQAFIAALNSVTKGALNKVISGFQTATNKVGSAIEFLSNAFGKVSGKTWVVAGVVAGITAVVVVILQLISALNRLEPSVSVIESAVGLIDGLNMTLNKIGSSFVINSVFNGILKVAAAIALVAVSLTQLASLDKEKLYASMLALGVMSGTLIAMSTVTAVINKFGAGTFASSFAFVNYAASLLVFAQTLSLLGTMENSINSSLITLTKLSGIVLVFSAIMSKVKLKLETSAAMTVAAVGLVAFAKAISVITTFDMPNILECIMMMWDISDMLRGITKATRGIDPTAMAALLPMGVGILLLAETLNKINANKITNMVKMMLTTHILVSAITKISKAAKKIDSSAVLALIPLSAGLLVFVKTLTKINNYDFNFISTLVKVWEASFMIKKVAKASAGIKLSSILALLPMSVALKTLIKAMQAINNVNMANPIKAIIATLEICILVKRISRSIGNVNLAKVLLALIPMSTGLNTILSVFEKLQTYKISGALNTLVQILELSYLIKKVAKATSGISITGILSMIPMAVGLQALLMEFKKIAAYKMDNYFTTLLSVIELTVLIKMVAKATKKISTLSVLGMIPMAVGLQVLLAEFEKLGNYKIDNYTEMLASVLELTILIRLVANATKKISAVGVLSMIPMAIGIVTLLETFQKMRDYDTGSFVESLGGLLELCIMIRLITAVTRGTKLSGIISLIPMAAGIVALVLAFRYIEGVEISQYSNVLKEMIVLVGLVAALSAAGKNAKDAATGLLIFSGAMLVLTKVCDIISQADNSSLIKAGVVCGVVVGLLVAIEAVIKQIGRSEWSKGTVGKIAIITAIMVGLTSLMAAVSWKTEYVGAGNLLALAGGVSAMMVVIAGVVKYASTINSASKINTKSFAAIGVIMAGLVYVLGLASGKAGSASTTLSIAAGATLVIAAVCGAAAILSNHAGDLNDDTILILAVTAGIAAGLILLLSYFSGNANPSSALAIATGASEVVLAIAGAAVILSRFASSMKASTIVTAGVAAVIAGVLIGVLSVCSNNNVNATAALALATGASEVLLALSASLVILGVVGKLGAAALIGAGILLLVVGVFGGIMAAIAAWGIIDESTVEKMQYVVEVFKLVGEAIGGFLGGVLGGFVGGALQTTLESVATGLTTFMNALEPALNVAKDSVDNGSAAALVSLFEALAGLAAVDGVSKLFGASAEDQLVSFGEGLSAFGEKFATFADSVKDVSSAGIEKAKSIADIISVFAEASEYIPNEGGWIAKVTGDNDLGTFASELATAGPDLRTFCDSVAGADTTGVDAVCTAMSSLVTWAKGVPNEGGLVAKITGDNSIVSFASELVSFGPKFNTFCERIKSIDTSGVDTCCENVSNVIAWAKEIPNEGGIVSFITGDNSLSTFSNNLVLFANSYKSFSDKAKEVNQDSIDNVIQGLRDCIAAAKEFAGEGFWNGVDYSVFDLMLTPFDDSIKTDIDTNINLVMTAYKDAVAANEYIIEDAMFAVGTSTAENYISGLSQGLTDGNETVKAGAMNLANIIDPTVRAVLEEKSPSKLAQETGGYYAEGLGSGMEDGIDDYIDPAALAVANATDGGVREELGIHSKSTVGEETGGYYDEGVGSGVKSGISQYIDPALTDVIDTVKDAGSDIVDSAVDTGKDILSSVADTGKDIVTEVTDTGTDTEKAVETGVEKADTALETSGEDIVQTASDIGDNVVDEMATEPIEEIKTEYTGAAKYLAGLADLIGGNNNAIGTTIGNLAGYVNESGGLIKAAANVYTDYYSSWGGTDGILGLMLGDEDVTSALTESTESAVAEVEESLSSLSSSASSSANTIVDIEHESLTTEQEYWRELLRIKRQGADADKYNAMSVAEFMEDVLNEATEAWQDYCDQVESSADSIMSSVDLFDAVEEQEAKSKDEIVKNLQDQIAEYKDYAETLAVLNQRLDGTNLVEYIRDMGVDSLAQLKVINSMTDDELADYAALYDQKYAYAMDAASTKLTELGNETLETLTDLFGGVTGAFNLQDFADVFDGTMDSITTFVNDVVGPNSEAIKAAAEAGVNLGESFGDAFSGELDSNLADNVGDIISTATEDIVSNNSEAMGEIGTHLGEGVGDGIANAGEYVADSAQELVDDTVTAFQEYAGIESPSTKMADEVGLYLGEGIGDGMNSEEAQLYVSDCIRDLIDYIVDVCTKKRDEFYACGTYVGAGFAEGIMDSIKAVESAAQAAANAADDTVRKALGISSPSKAFAEIGGYAMKGFAQGIRQLSYLPSDETREVGNAAFDALQTSMEYAMSAMDEDVDYEPTIRPIMDLSNVQSGTSRLNTMLNRTSALSTSSAIVNKSRYSSLKEAAAASVRGDTNYTFNQYNTSPKALSNIEIYRQTNNLISRVKNG